ncbi:MAG: uroporphyrinogen-III synthase [Comamonadaceae bacterium]|nr:MAG: uroporphyrinogen-III synthase [Comamonadaceae bacterium]
MGAPAAQVVVTRPGRECARWVEALQARGLPAVALPLIAIAPAGDPQPVREAWRRLEEYSAVMFVSANAVEQFFLQQGPPGQAGRSPFGITARAWAPGPGTAAALVQAGVEPARVDAPGPDAPQFDSEALWQVVAGQVPAGGRVLIVRGGDGEGNGAGRDWLAGQLAAGGVQVESVVAYVRHAPAWGAPQLACAREAARNGSVWLFSSSQAVAHLLALLPQQDWSQARAVATHPRIAQAARDAGFGVVCESRPSVDAVAAALESIR